MSSKEQFEKVFDEIAEEVLEVVKATKMSEDAVNWYKESLYYNCVGGKLNRGISVVDTYKLLTNKQSLSDDEYKKVAILGWCIELLQAVFLVSDDIMDASKTRRGKPCWYLKPGVGMIAINDALMLESAIYLLLKNHFKGEKYYVDLIELLHETTFQTEMGQQLDLITAPEDDVNLDKFSLDKYWYIVRYKTAFYSFYLPVALAMYMAGVSDQADLQQAKDVLLPLGEYFQVQDDYLDAFGDPEVIGKIGTDIQDNKCSWVVNKALQKANADQRKILDENYGRKDQAAEAKVKKLFDELELVSEYEKYEEEVVKEIREKIAQIDETRGFKGEVIEVFLKKIYKRQK